MSDPVCGNCYLASLTQDERDRIMAEPLTSCVFLCPECQAKHDEMIKGLDLTWWTS